MKIPDPFHLLVLVLCSLAFFIFGAYVAGGIIATSVTLTDQPESWVSAIATVMAAIGTVSTLIFLSYQHILDRKKKEEEDAIKLSQEALDSFIAAINSFIGYLTNNSLGKDRKFAFLSPTYLNLVAFEKKITIGNHRRQALAKFKELHVHLDIFYFDLTAEDFFTMDNEEANSISFSAHGRNWSSSVYALVIIWLKHVAPKFGTIANKNFTIYGWGQQMINEDFLYTLLAMLVSKDIQLVEIKSVVDCVRKLGQPSRQCRIAVDEKWFLSALNNYPLLLAHLFLRSSSFQAVKTSEQPLIFYPKFQIYGPENIWLCIDEGGAKGNINLRVPPALIHSRLIERMEHSNTIPNTSRLISYF